MHRSTEMLSDFWNCLLMNLYSGRQRKRCGRGTALQSGVADMHVCLEERERKKKGCVCMLLFVGGDVTALSLGNSRPCYLDAAQKGLLAEFLKHRLQRG